MTAVTPKPTKLPDISWPLLPDDFLLPDDPVDNDEQYPLAGALMQALSILPHQSQNALMVTNFALCAGVDGRTICKAPDWMYVQPVKPWNSPEPRRSYTPHTQGPVPTVVMEFLSETDGGEYSMESGPKIGKWFFYQNIIQVPTYVICEPTSQKLEVYQLEQGLYRKQKPNSAERYWIPGLDLFLGFWQGGRDLRIGRWLRWWSAEGELLLWPEEIADQERQQRQQAQQQVQQERQQRQRAQQQAEQAEERAALAEQRAALAEQQAAQLAAKLKAEGIDLED